MNNIYQIISGVVLLLILAAGGYVYYQQPAGTNVSELANTVTGGSLATTTLDADQDQTLQRLNELENITINTEFLSSDAFRSLENFGISIQPQPVGRSNPFEPAGVVAPANVSESSVNIDISGNSQVPQGTSTQSTTSIDQLLGGNEDAGNTAATSSSNNQ